MELRVIRTATLRLLPYLGLLYVVAYIDRSSVGFAKLTLQDDLGLSDTAFFMGAGAFFIAYAIFEVPSNLILERVGASRWFARIMLTWGLITILTAFVWNEQSFYALRFLLGAAEAGFYPGVIYFLTKWFPVRHRAKIFGYFIFANPISFAIGNPLLGWLSGLDGTYGLAGWQWIFIITGVPAVLLAVVTWFYLPDTPAHAKWLTQPQRDWITTELELENDANPDKHNPMSSLVSGKVWLCIAQFLMMIIAAYGLSYWLPTIVKEFGVSDTTTGFLTAIPYICAAAALFFLPRHADKKKEYWLHISVPMVIAGISMATSLFVEAPSIRLALMSIAAAGFLAPIPIFWAVTSRLFTGVTAAAALAMINSIGNLGGWLGPLGIGVVVDSTGSTTTGLWVIVIATFLGAILVLPVRHIVNKHESQAAPVKHASVASPAQAESTEPV